MGARLLITSAGIAGSNNLIRSLGAGDPSLFISGCHDDRFILKKSSADCKYLVPRPGGSRWAESLRRILRNDEIDLVIPTTDADVAAVSRNRRRLGERVFLPRPGVIELCQDKYRLTARLRAEGVPAPATYRVTDRKGVDGIFRRLAPRSRAWCRIRRGSGSIGAVRVRSPEQAWSWIGFWWEMRGVRPASFTLSEYLPGRDFGCQSLWKAGRLVLIKTYERLSYLGTGGQPSEVSSIAALAKTVFEPRVVEVSTKAVRALDAKASGVFSIDLREDARGIPCITEINAGRFSSATNIFDLTGKHNMAATYVRLALDQPVDVRNAYDVAEEHYMLRDLDTPAGIFRADDFFDEIKDVRGNKRVRRFHGRPS
jgi:glutathione synthase/RimK-type ligase-like ATP-grasp enzyme